MVSGCQRSSRRKSSSAIRIYDTYQAFIDRLGAGCSVIPQRKSLTSTTAREEAMRICETVALRWAAGARHPALAQDFSRTSRATRPSSSRTPRARSRTRAGSTSGRSTTAASRPACSSSAWTRSGTSIPMPALNGVWDNSLAADKPHLQRGLHRDDGEAPEGHLLERRRRVHRRRRRLHRRDADRRTPAWSGARRSPSTSTASRRPTRTPSSSS